MLLLDAVVGLAIISALAASVATAVYAQRKHSRALSKQREMVRLVEGALVDLRAGREVDTASEVRPLMYLTVTRLDTPAVDGWVWVEASSSFRERSASVVGLVPVDSLEGSGATP